MLIGVFSVTRRAEAHEEVIMKRTRWDSTVIEIAACLVVCVACSKKSEEPPAPAPAAPPPAAPATGVATVAASAEPAPAPVPTWGAAARAAGVTGTLGIEPNPVVICADKGVGVATISWTVTGTKVSEIHLNAPDGSLFTTDGNSGSLKTGQWVGKGTVFYLQDGAPNVPRTLDHTLARLEIETVVPGPCK